MAGRRLALLMPDDELLAERELNRLMMSPGDKHFETDWHAL